MGAFDRGPDLRLCFFFSFWRKGGGHDGIRLGLTIWKKIMSVVVVVYPAHTITLPILTRNGKTKQKYLDVNE